VVRSSSDDNVDNTMFANKRRRKDDTNRGVYSMAHQGAALERSLMSTIAFLRFAVVFTALVLLGVTGQLADTDYMDIK